jgi:sarcosine oxidase subunit gamma
MPEIAVMNCHAGTDVLRDSPLARVAVDATVPGAAVVLREHAFLGHLLLRGRTDAQGFAAAIKQVLGVALPTRPLQLHVDETNGVSVQWNSPDEWLIIVPEGQAHATELRLRAALNAQGGHYALVDVSAGQTLLSLSGAQAREVLMKSTPYDVHPEHFPPGKAVGTVFAKTSVLLRRPGGDRWELVVRRSFADYVARWLLDAGAEFGLRSGTSADTPTP